MTYIVYAVYSTGNSLGYFMTTLAMRTVQPGEKGQALGAMNTFMYAGMTTAGLLGGFLWTSLGAFVSFTIAFIACTASSVLILLTKVK